MRIELQIKQDFLMILKIYKEYIILILKLIINLLSLVDLKHYIFFFKKLVIFGKKNLLLVFCGDFIDLQTAIEVKTFFNVIGINICLADYIYLNLDFRNNFFFTLNLINVENKKTRGFLWTM